MLCVVTDFGVLDDGREIHGPGARVDLPESEAARLAAKGRIRIIPEVDQVIRLDRLVELAVALDRGDTSLWTKSGKPTTEALSELAGMPVSAQDRDAAWKIVLEKGGAG